MMKIYDLNQVPEEKIFARQEEAVDVSAPVADILRAVKERGTRPCWSMKSSSTGNTRSSVR